MDTSEGLEASIAYHWAEAYIALEEGLYTKMYTHGLLAQQYELALKYPDDHVIFPKLVPERIERGARIKPALLRIARKEVKQAIQAHQERKKENEYETRID